MPIFVSRDKRKQIRVFSDSFSPDALFTVVYRDQDSRPGFDSNEGGRQAAHDLLANGVLLATDGLTVKCVGGDAALPSHLRVRGAIALLGDPSQLSSVIKLIEERRPTGLRRRYGMPTEVAENDWVYGLWSDGLINGSVLDEHWLARNGDAIIWRISDFGLHCYIASQTQGSVDRRLAQFCTAIVLVQSEEDLPVH